MITIKQTSVFSKWLAYLKDRQARARIQARIDRLRFGYFGDTKSVGNGISELRIHCNSGYRVYFVQQGQELLILLAGGNKTTQKKDIEKAKALASTL